MSTASVGQAPSRRGRRSGSILLDLDDVAVGIARVDRKPLATGAAARDRLIVQQRHTALAQALHDGRERSVDREAEVQEAAVPRRRVVRRVGDEIEELAADPQRDERSGAAAVLVLVFHGEAEEVAVEAQRRVEIANPKNEMVEAADANHAAIMRRRRARAQAAPGRNVPGVRRNFPALARAAPARRPVHAGIEGASHDGMTAFLRSLRRLGLAGVGFVVVSSLAALAAAAGFLQPTSLLVTVGGALGVTWTTFPRARLAHAWALVAKALSASDDAEPVIAEMKRLGHVHRIDGIPALERAGARAGDEFLRAAVVLAVDARDETELREALVGEARRAATEGEAARQVLVTLGKLFPAFGLIGTLIGLVSLMRHLGGADLAAIGPGLGMAVLTTLYGAVLANVVVLPLSAKLHAYLARRALLMQMIVEGTILLHRREYPTRIERALRAYVGAPRPTETADVEPLLTERAA